MQLKNKCLGIHELNNTVIDLINNSYDENISLTFDDGLYSQFKYKDRVKNKNRIYFICPNLINTKEINDEDVTCYVAMSKHFYDNSNEYYMKLDYVKTLINEGYTIGAHSFYHENIKYCSKIKVNNKLINNSRSYLSIKNENYIREDTELMLNWFDKYLNIRPLYYCFPFNNSTNKLKDILKTYDFTEFFDDSNRIMI